MHEHEGTSAICVLTQNVPTSIFEQEVLRVFAVLNVVEIARILCTRINARDFYSSSNQAVPYN